MKLLMVCLGNICRSPLAEGILQHMIEENKLDWRVDSAGTSALHAGELPDRRSIQTALEHGIDIRRQRSRPLQVSDFIDFDLILAMDAENYQNILKIKPADSTAEVKMIMNYAYPNENRQVPDPYYDGGFENVYNMLHKACTKLIEIHR